MCQHSPACPDAQAPDRMARASRGRSPRARVEPAVQRRRLVRRRGRTTRRWPGGRASRTGIAPRGRRGPQGRHEEEDGRWVTQGRRGKTGPTHAGCCGKGSLTSPQRSNWLCGTCRAGQAGNRQAGNRQAVPHRHRRHRRRRYRPAAARHRQTARRRRIREAARAGTHRTPAARPAAPARPSRPPGCPCPAGALRREHTIPEIQRGARQHFVTRRRQRLRILTQTAAESGPDKPAQRQNGMTR
jgi:hypothetical protein